MDTPLPVNTVLNGATEIIARFNDGHTETVAVQLVSIRKASKYLDLVGDPAPFVEFVCEKPEGWADGLTDDSLWDLDTVARKTNDPRIDRFLTRQGEAVEKMIPMAQKVSALTNSLRK